LLNQVVDRLKLTGVTLGFNEEVIELLIEKGFDPALGARPLKFGKFDASLFKRKNMRGERESMNNMQEQF
jgi:hypothetical protein